jgi:glycosyltransferase involved in cell wall biosynthesis
VSGSSTPTAWRPSVALLAWGNVIEDFLETAGITLDEFCGDFVGSWMFGYVEALRHADVDTTIVCWSMKARRPIERSHTATGARILVLPSPRPYRMLAPHLRNPYGRNVTQVFGPTPRLLRLALLPVREAVLYLSTAPLELRRVLARYRFDAVLCQEYEFPRFDVTVCVGRLARVPIYAVFQGGDYQRSRLERLTRPPAMRAAQGFIVSTQREAARIRARYRVDPARIALIPNPVDTDDWRPEDQRDARDVLGIPEEARVIGWHGRISIHKKGLDVLVEAFSLLRTRAEFAEIRLLLIGSGHDDDELRRALAAVDGGVHWVNRIVNDRGELRCILAAADVYAFPSRHEGFAVAVLEAMAAGLPVVAADASGVREALGRAGLIVPIGDVEALARALEDILANPRNAEALGRAARERTVSEFSSKATGARLRDFLLPKYSRSRGLAS